MEEVVKIFALGGLDERGKNLYVIEINNDIFVFDCGMKYPEKTMPGIDSVMADITYLKNNKDRVKAFLITHYHNDVIGSLPYVLKEINAPVYATKRTCFYIKETAKNCYVDSKDFTFVEIEKDSTVNVCGYDVTFFSMTHSATDNVGIAFKTSHGNIVYSSDFIFDFSATSNYSCNINLLTKIAEEGVLCLMCESEGCEIQGYTAPNHKLTPNIEKYFRENGRVIISLYSQSAYAIYEVIDLVRKYNRKLCFYNRSMQKMVKGLRSLDLIKDLSDIVVDYSYLSDNDDVVILVSGIGQRVFRELIKLADGNADKNFEIKETDRIIIATQPVPGLEIMAANASDALYSSGAKVVTIPKKSVSSMHAHAEDIKMLINIENSQILVIDIQEKLLNAVFNRECVEKKSKILIKVAEILGLPVTVTEQYPQGLGETIEGLKENAKVFTKISFNALEDKELLNNLSGQDRNQVIIFGIETHICVHQTVASLIQKGFEVTVVNDACGSRSEFEYQQALLTMRENGAKIKSTEMVIFELLKSAKHPNFKEIQGLIK